MEHVDDGLPDDGVKGQQHQKGQQAPQAAAGHGHAFLLVKLLDSRVHFLLIVGVLLPDEVHLGGKPGHFHGAFLTLGRGRHQHQLHQNGKENQGKSIAGGELIQPAQQIPKGNGNQVR